MLIIKSPLPLLSFPRVTHWVWSSQSMNSTKSSPVAPPTTRMPRAPPIVAIVQPCSTWDHSRYFCFVVALIRSSLSGLQPQWPLCHKVIIRQKCPIHYHQYTHVQSQIKTNCLMKDNRQSKAFASTKDDQIVLEFGVGVSGVAKRRLCHNAWTTMALLT